MRIVVEHLENLIRIPSVSSLSNRPIVEYTVRVLQEAHCFPSAMLALISRNRRKILEPVMNYDPSGIASLLRLGVPPRGVLDRKLSEFNDLDGAIAAKLSF